MASRTRGRERLVRCDACGRSIPRDKSITYSKTNVYSTELRSGDDVKTTTFIESHYCISCAKHRRIFEKLKERAIRQASREDRFGRRQRSERWNSGQRW
ncbi:MAG: 40S ribosomal protein S26 [Candidatus Micrarchaeota archaeon]|nr:40S ribosomal protein S26 [Candidatus Micrarchaeota archaeon]